MALLAGCQNVEIREVTVVTYVLGDGCFAERGTTVASSVEGRGEGEVGVDVLTQSGAVQGAGAALSVLDRVLSSRVGCGPDPGSER